MKKQSAGKTSNFDMYIKEDSEIIENPSSKVKMLEKKLNILNMKNAIHARNKSLDFLLRHNNYFASSVPDKQFSKDIVNQALKNNDIQMKSTVGVNCAVGPCAKSAITQGNCDIGIIKTMFGASTFASHKLSYNIQQNRIDDHELVTKNHNETSSLNKQKTSKFLNQFNMLSENRTKEHNDKGFMIEMNSPANIKSFPDTASMINANELKEDLCDKLSKNTMANNNQHSAQEKLNVKSIQNTMPPIKNILTKKLGLKKEEVKESKEQIDLDSMIISMRSNDYNVSQSQSVESITNVTNCKQINETFLSCSTEKDFLKQDTHPASLGLSKRTNNSNIGRNINVIKNKGLKSFQDAKYPTSGSDTKFMHANFLKQDMHTASLDLFETEEHPNNSNIGKNINVSEPENLENVQCFMSNDISILIDPKYLMSSSDIECMGQANQDNSDDI